MGKIVIDPITRIEGHLKVEATVEGGVVKECKSSGVLFRGFEVMMRDRDPRDALHLTQRICGVCPTSHVIAAARNLDNAFGIENQIPENGRILRNLIQGANYVMSHIVHFYNLVALDYVNVLDVLSYEGKDPDLAKVKNFAQRAVDAGDLDMLGIFYPRYEGDYRLPPEVNQAAVAHYVQALNMRRIAQEASAIFSGRMPHSVAVVHGGATSSINTDAIANFLAKLQEMRNFVDNVYIPDVLAVAGAYSDYFSIGVGCGNLLSYGVFDLGTEEKAALGRDQLFTAGHTSASDLTKKAFDGSKITEDVAHSWYDNSSGLHPSQGETEPNPNKSTGYSWVKSPRYNDEVYEVGPLARMVTNYVAGDPTTQTLVNSVLSHFGAGPSALFSVLGRHAARALECKIVGDKCAEWALQLKPGEPVAVDAEVPDSAMGEGFWEAPRGALGHWVNIKDQKIKNYQCVVPTTWNASPMDAKGQPGPIEQAINGTIIQDEENPFEIVRIVRSFDPCLACAVHIVRPGSRSVGKFRVL
jgi:hydrogenase large subunit